MKSFVTLAVLLATTVAAQHRPHDNARMHRRSLNARGAMLDRRQVGGVPLPGLGGLDTNSTTTSESSTTSTSTSRAADPTTTATTSTTRQPDPPTTTTTSTTSSNTSTSTSATSTSTTSTSTSTTPTTSNTSVTAIIRTSQDTYQGTTFATARTTTLRGSTTSDASDPTNTNTLGENSFSQNKAAVAATATVAALVALGALVFLAFWWKKKAERGKMGEDMWDEASMKEFSHHRPASPGPGLAVPPPVAMRNVDLDSEMGDYPSAGGGVGAAGAGALGRSGTKVLPSQSAGSAALARARSQHHQQEMYEEPDELLAMPPVAHHDRPRDSAYDIVPAAPPAAAYAQHAHHGYNNNNAGYGYSNAAASGSGGGGGGLAPPARKGDHTSFGSGLGNDPFAGSGFVDAGRESSYGPGQAGRGAGGAVPGGQGHGHDAGVVANQWPQGYNPYTGYSQGSQAPYGGGYGYAN